MKIGVCVNHYHPSVGGAEIVAKNIVEYLSKYHQVYVFTRKLKNKVREMRDYSYPVFEYTIDDSRSFENKVKSLSLDFLFVYSDMFDFFRQVVAFPQPYKLILALCGANWIHSHRNFLNILYRCRNIHSIICHSTYERDYKICQADKLLSKVSIIPNGVWLSEFDQNNLSRKDLFPEIHDKIWILNVSNFFPGKGQEHLVNIISQLENPKEIAYIQVNNDIDFAIGNQLESIWKSSSKKLKEIGVVVKQVKNEKREKIIGLFKQSNIFAFTSEKEVAPVVLLEAMAASLPWVSTNVGNTQELKGGKCINTVKDSRFYSVFDRRTTVQFIDGIRYLLSNPAVGEQGREQIVRDLNWEVILPQYLKVIEK